MRLNEMTCPDIKPNVLQERIKCWNLQLSTTIITSDAVSGTYRFTRAATCSMSHMGVEVAPQTPTDFTAMNQLSSTSLAEFTK